MDFVKEFMSTYGVTILYSIITCIAGYVGVVVKRLYTKYINDKTKKDVVQTVVRGVEQIYKNLHGEEKLSKAIEAASEMLADKGISITEIELRMLIESAVSEFKCSFGSAQNSFTVNNDPDYLV